MVADILKFVLIALEVVLIFNLMILVHELGHFLAARWRGLVVEKFAIWFGKPLWKKTIGGVEYRLGSIPAGGFVAIPQLAPMEIMEGDVQTDRAKLPPVKPIDKIIVAAAGPVFSFGLAVVFATIVWIVGRPIGEAELNTTVGYVLPDGPAARAGLQPGDRIEAVNGVPVTQFSPAGNQRGSIVWNVIRSEAPLVPIRYVRDGQENTVDVEPLVAPRPGMGRKNLRSIGVYPAMTPRIAKVPADSAEAAAGFKAGDFILDASGRPAYGLIGLTDLLSSSSAPVPVTVERGSERLTLQLPPFAPRVESVMPGSPAAAAGVQKGDLIKTANGQPVTNLKQFSDLVQTSAGEPIRLTLERGGREITATLRAQIPEGSDSNRYLVGIGWNMGAIQWDEDGRLARVHPNPVQQVVAGATAMWDTLSAILFSQSGIGLQHLSGPVGIMHAYYILFEREEGWLLALWFSVVLNINLAIINLLPIPVLDGGHITLAIIEGIRRRPINVRVLEVIQNACGLLIIGFMLYVTFFDTVDLLGPGGSGPKFRPTSIEQTQP